MKRVVEHSNALNCIRLVFACLLFLALACPASGKTPDVYINISDPFLKKIPIAVPVFKGVSGNDAELAKCAEAADMLSRTLDFTSYFKLLDRGSFLFAPQKDDIVGAGINFQNWTTIGAELLITGGLLVQGDAVEAELRLFDSFKGQMLVGKKYRGRTADLLTIMRRFAGEVIYSITGERGIFDTQIAFVSTQTGSKEIFVCDFDGYDPKPVTRSGSISLSPAWSSDGQWLAFTSYARGKPELQIRHLKEKRGAIVSKEGVNISPAWFPGQFALAATLSFSGDSEIYLLTGNGNIIRRLTHNPGIDVSPSFSPDGKQMAFVSNRSGNPHIYIQELASGQVRRLTFQGRYNTQPAWSPKGDRIAYCGSDDGRFNIHVIGVKAAESVQLTRNAGNNESPSWSPDGNLIAFSSTRQGPSRIYVMNAYGTDQRMLLNLSGEQTSPRWSPPLVNQEKPLDF